MKGMGAIGQGWVSVMGVRFGSAISACDEVDEDQ